MRQLVLTSDVRTNPADWHSMAGWKRLALMGLMVSLPVPLFAASGLAVPLPSIVYRVAVGVAQRTQAVAVGVPGFEAVVTESTQIARRGAIRLSAEELAVGGAPADAPASAGSARTVEPHSSPRSSARPLRAPNLKSATRPVAPLESVDAIEDLDVAMTPEPEAGSSEPDDAPRASRQPVHPSREHPSPADERADEPRGDSTPAKPDREPEPKPSQPKDEPKTGPQPPAPFPPPAVTPPPPVAPPPPLPPLPVSPPIDPLPEPVPLTPVAQLEGIAADLRAIVVERQKAARRVDRVKQAIERVDNAVAQLEETPPDKDGAVGEIKNAIQKLDAALFEAEVTITEHSAFVTRLNAVSFLLKASPE